MLSEDDERGDVNEFADAGHHGDSEDVACADDIVVKEIGVRTNVADLMQNLDEIGVKWRQRSTFPKVNLL